MIRLSLLKVIKCGFRGYKMSGYVPFILAFLQDCRISQTKIYVYFVDTSSYCNLDLALAWSRSNVYVYSIHDIMFENQSAYSGKILFDSLGVLKNCFFNNYSFLIVGSLWISSAKGCKEIILFW